MDKVVQTCIQHYSKCVHLEYKGAQFIEVHWNMYNSCYLYEKNKKINNCICCRHNVILISIGTLVELFFLMFGGDNSTRYCNYPKTNYAGSADTIAQLVAQWQ